MQISDQRQGEIFIILNVLLWGVFPIFIQLSYSNVSPFISLSVSSFFAAIFFAIILTIRQKWHELFNKKALLYTLYSTFFIEIIFYLLYFFSLKYSSAGNISILAMSEAFFSFLLFHVWHKEYIPKEHIYGAILVLLGAVIILIPSATIFHIGDLFIIIGTAIVPFGNFFVQKARKLVCTESIMFLRVIIGSFVIFMLSIPFNATSPLPQIISSLPFLIINGVLTLGLSTIMWIEGIHRIPVTKANGIGALGPLITLLVAWAVFKTSPTPWQLVSILPMFLGIILIGKKI